VGAQRGDQPSSSVAWPDHARRRHTVRVSTLVGGAPPLQPGKHGSVLAGAKALRPLRVLRPASLGLLRRPWHPLRAVHFGPWRRRTGASQGLWLRGSGARIPSLLLSLQRTPRFEGPSYPLILLRSHIVIAQLHRGPGQLGPGAACFNERRHLHAHTLARLRVRLQSQC
jgi:hypothetical protein